MGVEGERRGEVRGAQQVVHGVEGGAHGGARRATGEVPAAEALEVAEERGMAVAAAGLRRGAEEVEVVAAYETRAVPPERAGALREMLRGGQVEVVLFTSGSTVASACDLIGADAPALLAEVAVASIGPITSRALAERGVTPTVTASTYTIDGLLDALAAHFRPGGAC